MPTYTWVADRTNNLYTLGNPPIWWNTLNHSVLVATVPSPVGAGDVLVRTELFAVAHGGLEGNLPTPSQPSALYQISIRLQGEVYTAGSPGLPDPQALGTSPAVITAALTPRTLSYFDTTAPARGSCSWSTDGIITSKAERGPAKYGAGHPELRVGMFADNVYNALLPGALNSSWNIWVRCLWRTP